MDYNLQKMDGDSGDIETAISTAAWSTLNLMYNGLPNQATVNELADRLLLEITGLTNPTNNPNNNPNLDNPVGVGNYIAYVLSTEYPNIIY